jgi:IS30 family transposase
LQRIVAGELNQDWSLQQIAGWLRDQYPESPEMWVSHETIYRSLFIQARGALKKTSSATFVPVAASAALAMPSTGVWARGFSMQSRKKFGTVDRRSLKLLKAYGWPANVRELQT